MYNEDKANGEGGGGDEGCKGYKIRYASTQIPCIDVSGDVCSGCKSFLRDAFVEIMALATKKGLDAFEALLKEMNEKEGRGIDYRKFTGEEIAERMDGLLPSAILEELKKHG